MFLSFFSDQDLQKCFEWCFSLSKRLKRKKDVCHIKLVWVLGYLFGRSLVSYTLSTLYRCFAKRPHWLVMEKTECIVFSTFLSTVTLSLPTFILDDKNRHRPKIWMGSLWGITEPTKTPRKDVWHTQRPMEKKKEKPFNGKMRMHNCNKMLPCNKGQWQVKTGVGITNEQCFAVPPKVILEQLPFSYCHGLLYSSSCTVKHGLKIRD